MTRCQFCSFDPTSESDYCDEHRPSVEAANRKKALETYDRQAIAAARSEVLELRWVLAAIAHQNPGIRVSRLYIEAHHNYATRVDGMTGDLVLVPR